VGKPWLELSEPALALHQRTPDVVLEPLVARAPTKPGVPFRRPGSCASLQCPLRAGPEARGKRLVCSHRIGLGGSGRANGFPCRAVAGVTTIASGLPFLFFRSALVKP